MRNHSNRGTNSFWKTAVNTPDTPAIIETGGKITRYGDLSRLSNRIVHAFHSLELGRGDSIAILGENNAEFLAIALAVLQSGMRLIPINPHRSDQENVRQLNECNPKLLIFSDLFLGKIKRLSEALNIQPCKCLILGNKQQEYLNFSELASAQSSMFPLDRCAGEFSFITSGTTGPSKIVARPLKLLDPDENATNQVSFLEMLGVRLEGGGIYLSTLPLYFSSNLFATICALHLGQTLLLMDHWATELFGKLVKEYGITYTLMLPEMFEDLLKDPVSLQILKKSGVEKILHSGVYCPIDLKLSMIDAIGPKLVEFYAGAEGGGTYITSEQWMEKPGSVGQPWPITQVKICDDRNRQLPPDKTGWVFLKTMNQSFEYLKDLKQTNMVWQSDFFTLGDRGFLDRDGFLFLEKRAGSKSIY